LNIKNILGQDNPLLTKIQIQELIEKVAMNPSRLSESEKERLTYEELIIQRPLERTTLNNQYQEKQI
jgi:uncharacterized protein YhaN